MSGAEHSRSAPSSPEAQFTSGSIVRTRRRTSDTIYFTGNVWPIEDESIDTVLCTETLEHVTEPLAFLREAARCLRPEGVLIVTVPFAARWHFIPHDYWRYTPSVLLRLMTGAGLTHVEVYARGNPVTVVYYKVMALILPLLLPQDQNRLVAWALRLAGLLMAPVLLTLAAIANISLRWGGDDCLGYTAVAHRPAEPART